MQQTVNCPSCASPITVGQKFCGVCGFNLANLPQQKPNSCLTCGSAFSPGQQFCGVCGTNLASVSQQPPQMAQAQNAANIRGTAPLAGVGATQVAGAGAVPAKKERRPRGYGILVTTATIFQIFGWIVLVFGIVSSIFIGIWPLIGGEVKSLIPGVTFDAVTVILLALGGIITSLLYGLGMLAFAEICNATIEFRKSQELK